MSFNPTKTLGGRLGFGGPIAHIGNQISSCVCCFLCVGSLFLLLGIIFLSAATVPFRENAIAAYNLVVDAWTGTYLPQYQGAAFTVYSNPPSLVNTSGATPMATVATSSGDVLLDTDLSTFKTYTKLRYTASLPFNSASSGISYVTSSSNAQGVPVYYSFANSGGSSTTPPPSSIPFVVVKSVDRSGFDSTCLYSTSDCNGYSRTVPSNGGKSPYQTCLDRPFCSTSCANQGGVWSSGTLLCTFTGYLKNVCFLVEKDVTANSWVIPAQTANSSSLYQGGKGCYYEAQNTRLGIPTFFPGTYASAQPSSVTFEVRHSQDPYVQSSKATSGTYRYGLTQAQSAETGAVFLGLGGAMWAVFIGVLVCIGKVVHSAMNNNSSKPVWGANYVIPTYQGPNQAFAVATQPITPGYAFQEKPPLQQYAGQPGFPPQQQQEYAMQQPQQGYDQQPGYVQQQPPPPGYPMQQPPEGYPVQAYPQQ